MGREHLIPMNMRTPEDVRRIAAMGGRATKNNPRSSMGQKLAWIRRKIKAGVLKTEDEKWLAERLTNPDAFAIDLLAFFDKVKGDIDVTKNPTLLSAGTHLFKAIHGERHKIESLNINLNVERPLTDSEKEKLLEFLKDDSEV